jgi:hypothetical protein
VAHSTKQALALQTLMLDAAPDQHSPCSTASKLWLNLAGHMGCHIPAMAQLSETQNTPWEQHAMTVHI